MDRHADQITMNELIRLSKENIRLKDALRPFICECGSICWIKDCPKWQAKQALKGEEKHGINEITGHPV